MQQTMKTLQGCLMMTNLFQIWLNIIIVMRKLSLTFPDQIADELMLLCHNRPKVCKKESQMGWTNNDRILIVRNNYLEYYNLHPGFIEDDPNSIKRKYFKFCIRLDFIHEVNFLPKNKIKKNYLELIFPERNKSMRPFEMMKSGEGNQNEQQEQSKDPLQQKLEKWLFQFGFDLKDYIEQKKQERKEEKRTLAKIVPLSPKEKIKFQMGSSNSPKTIKSEQKHEKNIEQYVNSIQRTKNFLKTKAEIAEQQAVRQKKKKEKEIAELMSTKNEGLQQTFTISSFWRDYFKYYELVIKKENKQKNMMQNKMENEIRLLQEIQYFNSIAIKIIQSYVDERNIGYDGSKKEFERFNYYQGLWIKTGGKELNQQFLVNYYLNDILYSLKDIKNFKFRLPLMSLIQYKGTKLLCMCDMPFSQLQKTQIYNLLAEGYDLQVMSKIKECLDILQDVLNVKSAPYDIDNKKKIVAPLGLNLKVFEYNYKKDKSQDQVTLPNFYYIINPGIVFPVDFNYQKERINLMARLRPELVAFFRDYYKQEDPQMLVQAFMKSSMPQDFKRHEDEKVIEASRLIQTYKVPELVNQLNYINLLFVDSFSIKSIMQEMGINIRYLHLIYESAELPYVRDLILAEVLARTIKKQFRQALKDLEGNMFIDQQNIDAIKNPKEKLTLLRQKKEEGQKLYKLMAVDYLNLIFGCGVETEQFWKIIRTKCKEYFKIGSIFPPKCKPGTILNAVLWHCGISCTYDEHIQLFSVEEPFKDCQDLEFETKVKTFDFPSFQLQKLFRSAPSLEQKLDFQVFKESSSKLLKLELLFNKNINPFNFETQVAISKLSNYHEYLEKPKMKNKMHPVVLPYYFQNKSEYNFQKALDIINFSLPETHPLYITLYLEYADVFQPALMKKTALMLAVKSFGQFHMKTTEMYSKFYHEGMPEYYMKAKRVKNIDACSIICQQMYDNQMYESCLNYCLDQIQKINDPNNDEKLGTGNFRTYLQMLMQGLDSTIKIVQLDKGIMISKQISRIISSFKLNEQQITETLFRQTLIIQLLKSNKKYFLYKMVLFVIHIKGTYERIQFDGQGCSKPITGAERTKILQGLASEYYQQENHANWIGWILATISKSFQYFNFLEDLFNNFNNHLQRYNSEQFKICLGYLDILIRIFGQKLFKQLLYDVKFN